MRTIDDHRVILHADMNCFYANVECLMRPELRQRPVVVGGDVEARHGIVLAKNRIAKARGVRTGSTISEARQACPDAVIVPPDYPLYMRFSRLARAIYYDYTDLVEPFGPDEAWLDCTGSLRLFGGDPLLIAEEISERVKAELGVTISVGVSWNKIFAKFGSDADPGDGIVAITPSNFREVVWEAPVADLLYVGPATERKLHGLGITSIGQIASCDISVLRSRLGKMGEVLAAFAAGYDVSPVRPYDREGACVEYDIRSIGNGLTAPHDITCPCDAKALIFALSESVGMRLRSHHLVSGVIGIQVRDQRDLVSYTRQHRLTRPTDLTREIAKEAYRLLAANEALDGRRPLRSLGVRASGLTCGGGPVQLGLLDDEEARVREERLDHAMDDLRRRFGNNIVRRTASLADPALVDLDIRRDNVVHPVGFFA